MDAPQEKQKISGYTYGTAEVAKSPITMEEWEELQKSALFSEEDVFYLRLSEEVLADQVGDLLKTWRGIIFDHPHLRAYDEDPKTHEVDTDYAKAVGKRFGQWVLDTARAKYDRAWLDYQYEIGLGHHRSKKNQTDAGYPEVTSQPLDSRAATAKTTPALTIAWQSVAGGVSTRAPKSPFPLYLWLTDNSDLGWGELYVGVTSLLLRQWQSQTRETVEHVRSVRRERRFVLPPSLFHEHFAALVLGRHCGESARALRMQLTALANAARPQSARQRAGSWTARGSYSCHG